MTEPREERTTVELRGREFPISYFHRAGSGETLLYLHGLGSTKKDFLGAWATPGLADYALVAFDAPGCGSSRGYRREVPLGMDEIVKTSDHLTRHLGLGALTVIGHSFGGLGALLFTLRHTPSVKRLVSVEGNLGPDDCFLSRRVFERRFLGSEEVFMEELAETFRDSGWTGFEAFAEAFRDHVEERAFFDYCRSIVDYSDSFPLLEDFIALDMPKLYIHGNENAHLSHLPRLREQGVEVVAVPESNHFPADSNPAFYYEAIADFVGRT